MSKKLRLEEIANENLKKDQDEEENLLEIKQQRIYAPLVWKRLSSGIRIQDLKSNYFEPVLALLEEHFLNEDVLFKNSKIKEDEESLKSFSERIMFNLNDHTSIIAIDEENEDAIAGILIFKAVNRCEYGRVFSRVQLVEGEAMKKVIEFNNNLSRKADIYELFNCEIFLRYYLICIHPDYRRKGLGFQLMHVGFSLARTLNIPVIMGLFGNWKLQKLAKRLGMQSLFEVQYTTWLDENKNMIFCDPGAGNYTSAIMAGEVPLPPQPPPPPPPPPRDPNAPRVPRPEKKKIREKKKLKEKK